ncbi:MAG: 2Fe-2S iron-sulfur cluster binding domain-containing protein, partial [Bryobacterales bacterium]|nr:2Fe-2S iron-sulfur cluster binding domain-containing protein [Bryobacterales bacterium]
MTLFDLADRRAIPVPTSCGRSGTCHECIVQVTRGAEALSEPTPAEAFLKGKYRLACQAEVLDPHAEIAFQLLQRRPKILTQTETRSTPLDPLTRRGGSRVVHNNEDLDEYRGAIYGAAVDLGTTTIVLEIVDLETGAVRHVTALENPQRFGGSDIMNRISYDA